MIEREVKSFGQRTKIIGRLFMIFAILQIAYGAISLRVDNALAGLAALVIGYGLSRLGEWLAGGATDSWRIPRALRGVIGAAWILFGVEGLIQGVSAIARNTPVNFGGPRQELPIKYSYIAIGMANMAIGLWLLNGARRKE